MDLPVFNISRYLNRESDTDLDLKMQSYNKLLGDAFSQDIKEFINFEIREWVEKILDFHQSFEYATEYAEYHQTSSFPTFNIRTTMQVYNVIAK
jgi:hypothetical protein